MMFLRRLAIAFAFAFVFFSIVLISVRGARADDRAASVLTRLFTEPKVDVGAFAPAFLAQIPPATISATIEDFRARLGALTSVEALPKAVGKGTYLLTFANGTLLATIGLESRTIAGLLLRDETSAAIRAALIHHFTTPLSADQFADSFLKIVPIDGVVAIERQLTATAGPFVRLDQRDGTYVAVFTKAEHPVHAVLDDAGRFTGLVIGPGVVR